ncbi:LuxR C-terminal-related transcriptional regulator [Amycolatopsis speibonae]|uniref:LuxR C-terminal-related transcriptional regulator n=1 Tax=Amycolatopsis speibonae TaxID=1450224 RepID=A0ABV7P5R2_9PSEU
MRQPVDLFSLLPRHRTPGRRRPYYREIGELPHISGKTVEHHMARIRAKLGAHDRRTTAALHSGMLSGE